MRTLLRLAELFAGGMKSSARLPWKRGPRAWEVRQRASEIRAELERTRCSFYSLRRTAALLGISTQPVRNWVREWLARPENREKVYGPELSLEEKTARMKAHFGMQDA